MANDILIPAGAVWSFLDDGSDQGSGWKEVDFGALGWGQGAAELGYGDGDEATVVTKCLQELHDCRVTRSYAAAFAASHMLVAGSHVNVRGEFATCSAESAEKL